MKMLLLNFNCVNNKSTYYQAYQGRRYRFKSRDANLLTFAKYPQFMGNFQTQGVQFKHFSKIERCNNIGPAYLLKVALILHFFSFDK